MLEIYKSKILKSETIDNKLIEYLETPRKRYLFGNGLQTAVCLGIFRDMKVEIKGVLLPPGSELKPLQGYWGRLIRRAETIRISEMSEEDKSNAYVMLAIPREEYACAERFLRNSGVEQVIGCCWEHNSELIGLCYDVWRQGEGQ